MYQVKGLLDNYANKLVNTMTGGNPTAQDLYNAEQTRAYMAQMARDQAMQQALQQNLLFLNVFGINQLLQLQHTKGVIRI